MASGSIGGGRRGAQREQQDQRNQKDQREQQDEQAQAGGWNPLSPLLAWLGLIQEFGTAALGSVEQVTQLTQAQWEMLRGGMALMSELPLNALEESDRELRRLREAVRAVQLQMEIFDEQLGALDRMLRPLHDWADAWRGVIEPAEDS